MARTVQCCTQRKDILCAAPSHFVPHSYVVDGHPLFGFHAGDPGCLILNVVVAAVAHTDGGIRGAAIAYPPWHAPAEGVYGDFRIALPGLGSQPRLVASPTSRRLVAIVLVRRFCTVGALRIASYRGGARESDEARVLAGGRLADG